MNLSVSTVIRTARSATVDAFQEWALRRRAVSDQSISNLPLAVVSLESEERDRALHELSRVAELEYERKRRDLEQKEEERRAALIDIVRAIDRVPQAPTGGAESAVLVAIARELQSVLGGALPNISRVELWVQDESGLRCVIPTGANTSESWIDDAMLHRIVQSGEPDFGGGLTRRASGSTTARSEQLRLGVPLVLGDQRLGAVLIQCENSAALTLEDRRYLELVGVQVSASVLTANLAGMMEHQTTVWAREQLAHHVLHSGGNAASNVISNARELQRLLRDPRISFEADLDLDIEQVVADIITDAELVRQTLDTLRTEAVEETVFDLMTELHALAEGMTTETVPLIHVRGPEIAQIFGVKALIRHALANIVQNAVQVLGERGAAGNNVVISIHRRSGDAPYWFIDVEDSGPGIETSLVDRIWEVGTHFRSRGNGYGLPFARRTLEASGGGLAYVGRSDELGGAHFRAWLPIMGRDEVTIIGKHPGGRRQ